MSKQLLKTKNSKGLIIEVGKTYYYYNIGLGEIKTHYVKRIESLWAVDSNGRVELDSLYETEKEVLINRLYIKAEAEFSLFNCIEFTVYYNVPSTPDIVKIDNIEGAKEAILYYMSSNLVKEIII